MDNILPFHPALPANQVKPNRLALVEVENQRVVLTRIEGELCAFNALCPHQLGDLSRGTVHNGAVECPVHGWRFNIRKGQSIYPEEETLCLRRYQVKEEAGMIIVKLAPPE